MKSPVVSLPVLQPSNCQGCGLCCEGIGSPVLLYVSHRRLVGPHPFRPEGLPQELIDEIDEKFFGLYRGQEPQQQCLWFDAETRLCRHYEWRPQICRDYELGGKECLELRAPYVQRVRPSRPAVPPRPPAPASPTPTIQLPPTLRKHRPQLPSPAVPPAVHATDVDTNTVDTHAVDTNAVDTNAVDTNAVDTHANVHVETHVDDDHDPLDVMAY